MSTIELTKETFEETVTQSGITLVDWWASWCGPCRMFAPVFQAASDEHTDVRFGKIDTEDQQDLAAAAQSQPRAQASAPGSQTTCGECIWNEN